MHDYRMGHEKIVQGNVNPQRMDAGKHKIEVQISQSLGLARDDRES